MIFAEQQNIPMLEVAGDWRLYLSDLFTTRHVQNYANVNPAAAGILQPERAREVYALLGNRSDGELADEENRLMSEAIVEGRRIFVVLSAEGCREFEGRFVEGRPWRTSVISTWKSGERQEAMEIMEVGAGQN
jgi:hypothetical protein